MKRSTDRILTTHAGRLDGPPELREKTGAIMAGSSSDLEAVRPLVRSGMIDIISKQTEAGIDIVSDGELGKLGFGRPYYGRRLSGLAARPIKKGESGWMGQGSGERAEFAEFYKELNFLPEPKERAICSGPITYIGAQEVANDLQLFQSALASAKVKPEEAFMCVLAPGWLEHFFHNEYYAGDEPYLFALADAMKHEYKAIVDAGFILQIDDPALPDTYDMIVPRPTIGEYRRFAEVRVEAVNHALGGLPEDRVRYHICWGSWHGPHTHDLPLKHLVDLMLKVKAGAYSVEAANPRHEHEWKVWRDVKLPDGKILIPGVVSHASNVVEHPELVADRIALYAGLVGRENVIAGTDCGMGLRVHPQICWAKLKALGEGAALASKQLWPGWRNPHTPARISFLGYTASMIRLRLAIFLLGVPLFAQWLHYPTPGIPRTPDGKPNLSAPAPRAADGHPDFTGLWSIPLETAVGNIGARNAGDLKPSDMQPWAQALVRQRSEDLGKDNPRYKCLPEGPGYSTGAGGLKRFLQTRSMLVILNEDLTSRQIFMDGRSLEASSNPSWMGYAVGHWDGETLVVESSGYNDRTWLLDGYPHTEALRMTERYRRPDFGHLEITVTFEDPGAYSKAWTVPVHAALAADTEMMETVCNEDANTRQDHWVGKLSDDQKARVNVAPATLANYVGVYKGPYIQGPRTVEVTFSGGTLFVSVDGGPKLPIFPQSETSFSGTGLTYRFVRNERGIPTSVLEGHVSGEYNYERQK